MDLFLSSLKKVVLVCITLALSMCLLLSAFEVSGAGMPMLSFTIGVIGLSVMCGSFIASCKAGLKMADFVIILFPAIILMERVLDGGEDERCDN